MAAKVDHSGGNRWLLLFYQVPPKPPYLRVKISRRLTKVGALGVKPTVYVLPRGDEALEDFQWVARELAKEGGGCDDLRGPSGRGPERRRRGTAVQRGSFRRLSRDPTVGPARRGKKRRP